MEHILGFSLWSDLCDATEKLLYRILIRDPSMFDALFDKRWEINHEYLKTMEDPDTVSIGYGEDLKKLQELDIIMGRLRIGTSEENEQEIQEIAAAYNAIMANIFRKKDLRTLDVPKELIRRLRFEASQISITNPVQKDCAETMLKASLTNVDGIKCLEKMFRSFYKTSGVLWEQETIKKAIGKTRRKLFAYMKDQLMQGGPLYKEETADDIKEYAQGWNDDSGTAIEEHILYEIFTFNQNPSHGIYESPSMTFVPEQYRDTMLKPFLFYMGFSRWRINYANNKNISQDDIKIAQKAVDKVIRSYIMAFLYINMMECVAYPDVDALPSDTNEFAVKCTDLKFLYKCVSRINYGEMTAVCFFAIAQELERRQRTENTRRIFLEDKTPNISRLTEKNFAMSKEIITLKTRIATLEEELEKEKEKRRSYKREVRKAEGDAQRISELNKANLQLERELAELRAERETETAMLREQLEDSATVIEEDTAFAQNTEKKNVDIGTADVNGRYLFLCSHEPCARKIRETFPNSVTTEDYVLHPSNAQSFKAAVCITSSISHRLYYKTKDVCKNAGVPFINCNTVNMDTIKRLLVEQGFTTELGTGTE